MARAFPAGSSGVQDESEGMSDKWGANKATDRSVIKLTTRVKQQVTEVSPAPVERCKATRLRLFTQKNTGEVHTNLTLPRQMDAHTQRAQLPYLAEPH